MLADCTPHFLFDGVEKKTGGAPSKRKDAAAGRFTLRAKLQTAGGGWLAGPLPWVRDGNAVVLCRLGAGWKIGIDFCFYPRALRAPLGA